MLNDLVKNCQYHFVAKDSTGASGGILIYDQADGSELLKTIITNYTPSVVVRRHSNGWTQLIIFVYGPNCSEEHQEL